MACAGNSRTVGEALFELQTLHRAYEYHIDRKFSRSRKESDCEAGGRTQ
jgi:hypothetical protein